MYFIITGQVMVEKIAIRSIQTILQRCTLAVKEKKGLEGESKGVHLDRQRARENEGESAREKEGERRR